MKTKLTALIVIVLVCSGVVYFLWPQESAEQQVLTTLDHFDKGSLATSTKERLKTINWLTKEFEWSRVEISRKTNEKSANLIHLKQMKETIANFDNLSTKLIPSISYVKDVKVFHLIDGNALVLRKIGMQLTDPKSALIVDNDESIFLVYNKEKKRFLIDKIFADQWWRTEKY